MSTPTVPGATGTTTSTRGRKPGSKAKERPPMPADEFVIEDIPADSRGYVKRQRLERKPEQIAVDRQVMVVYQQWVEAGEPAKWQEMPVKGWTVSKNRADDADFMLRKAATLHNKKLVVGKLQTKPLPGLPLPEGKVRIPFCVVARKTVVTGLPAGAQESE